eukprot:496279-Prymnesium_polylepis.1
MDQGRATCPHGLASAGAAAQGRDTFFLVSRTVFQLALSLYMCYCHPGTSLLNPASSHHFAMSFYLVLPEYFVVVGSGESSLKLVTNSLTALLTLSPRRASVSRALSLISDSLRGGVPPSMHE